MNDETRQKVLERDNHECHFCDSEENLHVHHIIPRRADGSDEPWNLKTVCASCHKKSEELHSRGLEKIKEELKEEKIEGEVEERLEERGNKINLEDKTFDLEISAYRTKIPKAIGFDTIRYVGADREKALEELEREEDAIIAKNTLEVSVELNQRTGELEMR